MTREEAIDKLLSFYEGYAIEFTASKKSMESISDEFTEAMLALGVAPSELPDHMRVPQAPPEPLPPPIHDLVYSPKGQKAIADAFAAHTPEEQIKKMFGDGPSLFEQMISNPPDEIVRKDNGEVWHYWKMADDD